MDKREREILAAGTGMVRLGSPDGQHSIFPRAVPDIVQGGELVAYLAAYWSRPGAITPLNGDFADYDDASVLYLHDMAVSEAAAGQGLAGRMVQALKAQARARGVQRTALVSVQGSRLYWERQGYAVQSVTNAVQQQHLDSYGEGALYMVGFI